VTVGVNASNIWPAGVVLCWRPPLFWQVFHFFPSAELLNTCALAVSLSVFVSWGGTQLQLYATPKDLAAIDHDPDAFEQCCCLPHPSGPSGWSRSHKTDARACVIYWQPRSCFWSHVNVTPSTRISTVCLNFSSIITDLFTDFSQLVMRLIPAHISSDLIINRNWLIYWK